MLPLLSPERLQTFHEMLLKIYFAFARKATDFKVSNGQIDRIKASNCQMQTMVGNLNHATHSLAGTGD